MTKLPSHLVGVAATILPAHKQTCDKLKADSRSKFGLVQKPGFNIPFLTPQRLAQQLGISVKTLERMRTDGSGPPFIRISSRRYRYPISGVDAWLVANSSNVPK